MTLPRRRFLQLAASASALPALRSRRRRANLPVTAGAAAGRLCARRRQRHRGTADRANGRRAARPAIHHRKPPRGRQQPRHRSGRAGKSRWLYAARSLHIERVERDALPESQVRLHPRHRAGREHGEDLQCDDRQQFVSGEDRSGVHRLCEGQPRQDQHGIGRSRKLAAPLRRAVQGDDRRRHGHGALSRRRPCDPRAHRRAHPGDVRLRRDLDRADQGGHGAGPRR